MDGPKTDGLDNNIWVGDSCWFDLQLWRVVEAKATYIHVKVVKCKHKDTLKTFVGHPHIDIRVVLFVIDSK